MIIDSSLFANHYLFKDLTLSELEDLKHLAFKHSFNAGDNLVVEGQSVDNLVIILRGEVEIKKSAGIGKPTHRVATVHQSECVGEMYLLDLGFASASAIAVTHTEVLLFPITAMRALAAFAKIRLNVGAGLSQRLRNSNAVTAISLQLEQETSKKIIFVMRFFITTLLGVLMYVVALNIAICYLSVVKTSTVITVPFLILFLLIYGYFLKTSGMPKAFFGLTMANWREALMESLKFTIPILVILVLIKWVLTHTMLCYAHQPLFDPFCTFHPHARASATTGLLILFAVVYGIFSVVQELLVRGIVQGSLEYFLQGRYKTITAIILANIIFAVLHVHISIIFSVLVFFPGLLWGFLYSRNRTLIGVGVSHILIGVWAGFVLGMDFLFRTV